MYQVKDLNKLTKWWWGQLPPYDVGAYPPNSPVKIGLGRLLKQRPDLLTSYNMTYSRYKRDLLTWSKQEEMVRYIVGVQPVANLDLKGGGTLGELSCILPELEFFREVKKMKLDPRVLGTIMGVNS